MDTGPNSPKFKNTCNCPSEGKCCSMRLSLTVNRSYTANCPKGTYLLNVCFVSMSIQAVLIQWHDSDVKAMKWKKERERKKGRKEIKKNMLTEFLSSLTRKFPHHSSGWSVSALTASCRLINHPFPHGNGQHLVTRTVLYISVKASPEISPMVCFTFRGICPDKA